MQTDRNGVKDEIFDWMSFPITGMYFWNGFQGSTAKAFKSSIIRMDFIR